MKSKSVLANSLRKALAMLQCGDPVEAVTILEMSLDLTTNQREKLIIHKAKDEADIGSPERAEHLIGMILN